MIRCARWQPAIGTVLLEYRASNIYWNTIYVYNAEFEIPWDTVWVDK